MAQIQILLRSFLHISSSDGRDFLRIGIPVVRGQVVELLRDDVLQQGSRLLERECKAADDGSPRVVQLFRRYGFIPQSIELVHELFHRTCGDVSPDFGTGDPGTAKFRTAEIAIRTVGVAFVFTQIEEEPAGWTTTEHAVGQQHCKIIRTRSVDTERSELQNRLHRAGSIDQVNTRIGLRRGWWNGCGWNVALLPIAKHLLNL